MSRPLGRAERDVPVLVKALRDIGEIELASRVWSCAENRAEKRRLQSMALPGWTTTRGWRCDRLACPSCRRRAVNIERNAAAEIFEGMDNRDCSLLTITLARVGDLAMVRDVIQRAKQMLQQARRRLARADDAWAHLTVVGYVEVDAVATARLSERPPQVRSVIESLTMIGDGDTTWVPHLHLSVHHPGIDRSSLREALTKLWPGDRRTDVQAFHSTRSASRNASRITTYGLKHRHETLLDTVEVEGQRGRVSEPWLMKVRAEYYRWLCCSVRDGFRALRVRLDPVGQQRCRRSSMRVHKAPLIEPMPITF